MGGLIMAAGFGVHADRTLVEDGLRSGRVTTGITLAVAAVVVLSACAPGPNNVATVDAPHIAGFWLGLWHGIISPVTFVISLFNDNVNVYEVHNNGNWYNFGFVLGVSVVFGGGSRASDR